MESEALNERPATGGSTAEAAPQNEASGLTDRIRFDADSLRKAYRRSWRPWFRITLVEGAVFLGAALWFLFRYYEFFSYSPLLLLEILVVLACSAGCFWRAFTTVNRYVKRTIQRMEESRRVSGYDMSIRFPEDEIRIEASVSNDVQHCPYDAVKRILIAQDLILVRSRSKQFLMLDQNRFENGTEADFWRLMNEKCPKAVPRAKRIG